MTGVKKGDKVLSLETGKLFGVKVVTNSMSVLESENELGCSFKRTHEFNYNHLRHKRRHT